MSKTPKKVKCGLGKILKRNEGSNVPATACTFSKNNDKNNENTENITEAAGNIITQKYSIKTRKTV